MIYKMPKRDIACRYGVVVISHGELAGRFGYFDDDVMESPSKGIIYLYDREWEIDRSCYYEIFKKHFVRIEINERFFKKLQSFLDDNSYGWDRFNNPDEPFNL